MTRSEIATLVERRKPGGCWRCFFDTFHDRQIAYGRRIYDVTGVLVQIGVLKARPA